MNIFESAKQNDVKAIMLYMDNGGDINAKNDLYLTLLMVASLNGCYDTAKLLVDAGADPDAQSDDDGATALMEATGRGFIEIVRLLIEAHANIDLKEKPNGFSALLGAAATGQRDIVKFLIESGADVNSRANQGGTALMIASARGYDDIVRLLIDANADVNAKEEQAGWTALVGAERGGHPRTVEILREAMARAEKGDSTPEDNTARRTKPLKINLGDVQEVTLESIVENSTSMIIIQESKSDLVTPNLARQAIEAKQHEQRADSLAQSREFKEAAEEYKKAIEIAPYEDEILYMSLGGVLSFLREFTESLENLEIASAINPLNEDVARNLRICRMNAGKT